MHAGKSSTSARKRAVRQPRFDFAYRPRSYRWPRKRAGDDGPREVVIARVAFSTPHADSITVLAKRSEEGRIRYSMLHRDAHGRARHRIRIRPASSDRPLSFEELVGMIESACFHGACPEPDDQARFGGVIWGTLQLHFEHGIDHAEDYLFFATVTSDHYPQLEAYYRSRMSEWCLAHCEEEEDCKRIVRMRLRRR